MYHYTEAFYSLAKRPMNVLEEKLFSRTFCHSYFGSIMEWVSADWLQMIANPTPRSKTDLGDWGASGYFGMDVLWNNLLEKGMRDPFYIGAGRETGYVRLETGNQRIGLMIAQGISHVPAVAYVSDHSITRLEHGSHEGQIMKLKLAPIGDSLGPYPVSEFHRPSDIFDLPLDSN